MPLPLTRHAMGRAGTLPEPAPAVQAAQPEAAEADVLADEVAADVPLPDEGEPDFTEIGADADPEVMRARARSWQACSLGQRAARQRLADEASEVMAAAHAEADRLLAAARERAAGLTTDAKTREKRADGLAEGARVLGMVAGAAGDVAAARVRVGALEHELGVLGAARIAAEGELTRLRTEQRDSEHALAAALELRDRDGQKDARDTLTAIAAEIGAAARDRDAAASRHYDLQKPGGLLEQARQGLHHPVGEALDFAFSQADPGGPAAGRVKARAEAATLTGVRG